MLKVFQQSQTKETSSYADRRRVSLKTSFNKLGKECPQIYRKRFRSHLSRFWSHLWQTNNCDSGQWERYHRRRDAWVMRVVWQNISHCRDELRWDRAGSESFWGHYQSQSWSLTDIVKGYKPRKRFYLYNENDDLGKWARITNVVFSSNTQPYSRKRNIIRRNASKIVNKTTRLQC